MVGFGFNPFQFSPRTYALATIEAITTELRNEIIRGDLKPGDRMPDRQSLTESFGSSPVTVQAAMRRLAAEGFVEVGARKLGTFVTRRPPHLHHYKLLFPQQPDTRNEFWRVLRDQACDLGASSEDEFTFFYGMSGHRDIRSFEALVEDVEYGRIAGLIFASSAAEFRGTPILDHPGIPRVALAREDQLPGVPKLGIDLDSFCAQAVAHLRAAGRTRIAVLIGGRTTDDHCPVARAFEQAMAANGLTVGPAWIQFVPIWSRMGARQAVRLLLHGSQSARPDGLIVTDDNFLPSATQGVVDAGVAAPEKLAVVTVANFPASVEALTPVTRIGFDVRAVLEDLAATVDAVRTGEDVPAFRSVEAITEAEYQHRCENR